MAYEEGEGKESEWNEANLKAKRLNDIQERINFWRVNLKGFTDGTYHYVFLLRDLENLYGEGRSKYSENEKKELDRLRVLIGKTIKLMPPHLPIKTNSMTKKQTIYLFSEQNYENLISLLYEFEIKIKDYNDDHGLTTRNKTTEGLFG